MAGRIGPATLSPGFPSAGHSFSRNGDRAGGGQEGTQAILKGLDVLAAADAPLSDLVKKNPSEISRCRQAYIRKNSDLMRRIFERRAEDHSRVFMRGLFLGDCRRTGQDSFEVPGTVLHLDGDKEYLEICRTTYSQLGIKATTMPVPKKKQADVVIDYLNSISRIS